MEIRQEAAPTLRDQPASLRTEDPKASRDRWAKRLDAIRIVETHEFPADENGIVRQITWFETALKQPLVRLEQRWGRSDATDGPGMKLLSEEAVSAGHLLVGLDQGVTTEAAIRGLSEAGFTVSPVAQTPNLLSVEVPNPTQAESFDATLVALRRSPYHVVYAEADPLILIDAVPSDPKYGSQWNLTSSGEDADASLNAEAGWQVRTDASNVVVAVTDTGTRTTHEDLAANLWINLGETPGNNIDDDNNGVIDDINGFNAITTSGNISDDNGHGTHVAGIIGARGNNNLGITGVAWNVRLLTCKFLNNRGVGTTSDAVAAIHYARLHGADIINASWSMGSRSLALEEAIRQAGAAGIVFVAAAGNQATDIDAAPRYPAASDLPNIVAIGATDRNRALTAFSNYGRDRVHLAAPGEGILSSYNQSDNQYVLLSGTSMAAPQAAGALALLKAMHPSEDGLQLIQRLLAGTRLAPALSGLVQTGGILHLPTLLATESAATPHDLCESPYLFTGYQGVWSGSTAHAGRSPSDPAGLTGTRTLWFSWTAPVSGHAEWQVNATDEATFATIYRLDGTTLSSLQTDSGSTQKIRVWVDAGRTYLLGVGTTSADGHAVTVNLALPPANDLIAAAALLTGESFSATGNNRGATRESGEPRHARVGAGRSVWWSWTAPRTTRQVITTLDSSFDTVLAVYRQGNDGALIEVSSNDDSGYNLLTSRVAFDATEGVRYLIAVDSWGGDSASGAIRLGGYGLGNILILNGPRSQSVQLGSSISLQVRFLSTIDTTVHWFKDAQPIGGGRDGTLVIGNVGANDLGSYHAVLSNADESVTSEAALLTERISAPFITWSTGNLNEVVGNPITLRVVAQGSQPWTLQWLKDGQPIDGATSESLFFGSLAAGDAGQYEVVITNASGVTRSTAFKVTVANSPFTAWNWVTAPDQGWPIQDIRYLDTTYHAIASAGGSTKVLRSTDGVNWQAQMLPPAFDGYQIDRGNNTLIIAGRDHTTSGNGSIYRSTDGGETWSLSGLPFRGNVTSLQFGGGYFVALNNYDGTLRRSTNGTSWQAPVTPPANGMNQLTFQGGTFFTYNSSNSTLYRSTDGGAWSAYAAGGAIRGILHNAGVFHLWTATTYLQSSDGITWTLIGSSASPDTPLLIHDGTRIISASSSQLSLRFSDTGISWATQTILNTGASTTIKKLLRGGGRTLAGCANGMILSSPDSTLLENTFSPFAWTGGASSRVEFCEDEFILTSRSNTTPHVALSSDGQTWKKYVIPDQTDLAGSRIWKAGGYYWANSRGALSTNTFWRGRSPLDLKRVAGTPSDSLSSILFKDGRFFAVAGTQLITSTNEGLTWSSINPGFSLPSGTQLYRAGSRWFLIGYNTLASSTDGFSWSLASRPNTNSHDFLGFAENNGKFYVVTGSYNQIWESTDGINWTINPLTFSTSGFGGIYAHRGTLLLLPYPNVTGEQFLATTDLTTWQTINTGISAGSFATGRGIMVGVSPTPHIVYNGQTPSRAPVCRLLSPLPDVQFTVNNLVELSVNASAPDGTFDRVELYVDDLLVATSTTPGVFRYGFSATENRSYSFHARAYNTDGLVTTDSTRATAKSPMAAPLFVTSDTLTSSNVFSDDDAYYAVSGTSLYRSIDGIHWEFHSITTSLSSINEFSLDDNYTRLHYTNGTGMVVSRDGLDWISITTNSPVQYRSGVYFRYTSSGGSGTGSVSLSSNGSAWVTTPARAQTYFTTVLMGDGPRYLGWSSTIHPYVRRSDDGINWVNMIDLPRPAAGIEALGRFILRYLDNKVRTSSDGGVTWTTSDLGVTVDKLLPVGDVVFAVYGSSIKKISTDGIVWQTHQVPDLSANVAYGDGLYVSVGSNNARVSTDGVNWTTHTPPWAVLNSTPFIVHGPAGFIAFHSGQPGWISTDGVNWTEAGLTASDGGSWQKYAAIGDTQIAIRDVTVPLNPIKRSLDAGKTWSFSSPPYAHPVMTRDVYSTGSSFVLRDSNGKLYRSNDGTAWTSVPVVAEGTNIAVTQLITRANLWHAVANNGYMYRSTDDGVSWNRYLVSATPGVNLVEIHFSGLHYLAVAYASSSAVPPVFRSDDGVTWTPTTLPATVTFSSRRSAGLGQFVIIQGIKTYLSNNGTDWTAAASSPVVDGLAYPASDAFYLLNNGSLYRSVNADGWTLIRTGVTGGLVELNGVLHAFGGTATTPLYFADAAIQAVQVSSGTYGIGDTLTAQVTIANLGATLLPEMDAELYLSRDTFHGNGDDIRLGALTIAAASLPPPGETRIIALSLVLPPNLEGGEFYTGIRLDPAGRVGEFSKSNNRRFTTTSPINVPEWTLDLETTGNGGVAQSVSAVRYVHGSTVTLSPSAGKNASFAGWSGSESSDRPDLTLTMRDNKVLTASFAEMRQLSVTVRGAGAVQLDQAGGRYAQGAQATLQAIPSAGWRFVEWQEDLAGGTPTRTLLMNTDRAVVAKFDYPLENWKAVHFTPTELADPAISGDDARPDPHGISNLMSYLSGRAPRSNEPFNTAPEVQGSTLFYRYTRNTGAVGSSLIAEVSTDLVNWTVSLSERVIDESQGVETVEVVVPRESRPRLFIRLRSVPNP
ncbi:S8 family serine peptidase [Rariglobus hedericola]